MAIDLSRSGSDNDTDPDDRERAEWLARPGVHATIYIRGRGAPEFYLAFGYCAIQFAFGHRYHHFQKGTTLG